jgi:nicotine blue oxidoreductase
VTSADSAQAGALGGLVLAAGSGSRMGRPKALITGPDGQPWVLRAVNVLRSAGCFPVFVVVGAAADEVRAQLLAAPAREVVAVQADDWAEGMGASLRAGLRTALEAPEALEAVVVMLVDTPGVTADVDRRLADAARSSGERRLAESGPGLAAALARASYDGAPGHPVLIGRAHWQAVLATARGDRGARDYLRTADVAVVECGNLGSGVDADDADALAAMLEE